MAMAMLMQVTISSLGGISFKIGMSCAEICVSGNRTSKLQQSVSEYSTLLRQCDSGSLQLSVKLAFSHVFDSGARVIESPELIQP